MTEHSEPYVGLFYDRLGNEITVDEWAARFAEDGYRQVRTTVTATGVHVSTIWFGINMGRVNPPKMFETLVAGSWGESIRRWSSLEAALDGHADLVARHGGERSEDRAEGVDDSVNNTENEVTEHDASEGSGYLGDGESDLWPGHAT